ncbi:hypothetical protein ALC57_15114 [Trachymyrmex cornetzi]|uniref:Uncharacterized protein n=1 Tax=Trachymyrmex cornetzi TaxID=471704 RepID=A0A151IXR4_9HYME|nr:hypothetical protein ALC57_15114 [Trachymyrmex cornetzi]
MPTIIGSQTDLSDVEKLHYLKSALIGDAANKNYAKAWKLLERAYKQHIASLDALGVSVGSEMMVHILESKLPKVTLDKWEVSLDRDEFPKLDQLYEFLYKTAVRASKREKSKASESEKCKGEPEIKKKCSCVANKAFVVNVSRNCVICKTKQHPLYRCDKFKQLPIPKRIEAVRNAKICYNCLRSHRDRPCKFSECTICQKRHNTLLRLEGYATSSKIDATKPETNQS